MVTIPGPELEERLRQLNLLSPIDPDVSAKWRPAPRIPSLSGKVGGFLGNRKANADLLLLSIRELLEKHYELGDAVVLDKFIYSRPAAAEIVDRLSERCDFVVTAVAD